MQAPSTHINKDFILSKLPVRVKVKKERENIEIKRIQKSTSQSGCSSILVSIEEPNSAYYRFIDREIVSSYGTKQQERKYNKTKTYLEIYYWNLWNNV